MKPTRADRKGLWVEMEIQWKWNSVMYILCAFIVSVISTYINTLEKREWRSLDFTSLREITNYLNDILFKFLIDFLSTQNKDDEWFEI